MEPPKARPVSGQPVRKIGRSFGSSRGRMNGNAKRHAYESGLERDLLELLAADPTVEEVTCQPLVIHFKDPKTGEDREYTPDILVRHGGEDGGTYLIEVKPRERLWEGFWKKDFKPRFLAARKLCRENGWTFVIRTEVEIKGPKIGNLVFLKQFATIDPDPAIEEQLAATLAAIGPSTPQALLAATLWHEENRAKAIPHLWRMVRNGRIEADLRFPLTMASRISMVVGEGYKWTDPYSYR